MRVLFALTGSENQEEKIVQTYKEKYGENLEVASVYFFKSLIDTVKKSAPFDRIIIHENFEAKGKKNKDVFDEYLFNNLDMLTDTDELRGATIIFLCGDHRKRDDKLLNSLFNMGIYNILIGSESTFSRVCELIKKPMTKKDAKRVLEVNVKNVTYEDPNHVDESELRSIREYYAKNINNKEKIIAGFDNSLYEQYTIQKLRTIISFLPSEVRDILYVNSDKYRAVLGDVVKIVEVPVYMDENKNIVSIDNEKNKAKEEPKPKKSLFSGLLKKDKNNLKLEENDIKNEKETITDVSKVDEFFKPVYKTEMPVSEVKNTENKPNVIVEVKEEKIEEIKDNLFNVNNLTKKEQITFDMLDNVNKQNENNNSLVSEVLQNELEEPVKIEIPEEVKAEEPVKIEIPEEVELEEPLKIEMPEEVKAEEPLKIEIPEELELEEPVKIEIPEEVELEEPVKIEIPEEVELEEPLKIEIQEEVKSEEPLKVEIPEEIKEEEPLKVEIPEEIKEEEPLKIEISEEVELEEPLKIEIPEEIKEEELLKVEIPEEIKEEEPLKIEIPEELELEEPLKIEIQEETKFNKNNSLFSNTPQIQTVTQVIEREVIKEIYETPSDYKKAIAFIGAHKAGTTFIINAIASMLTSKGVKTAILDLTKNKDTYTIYAGNNSEYKEIAGNSIPNLAIGQDVPLRLGDLSIYTGIPRVDRTKLDAMRAIEKIRNQNAVILVDCDFTTSIDIFRLVNNIFVIQDMDVTNILPITMFLKELKVRDIELDKVEVVVNKYIKSSLSVGKIVEALSYYTNPEMTFVNELLSASVKRFVVPFDEQNYLRYVEALYNGKLNFEGFSDEFKEAIASVVHDIFPISSTANVAQQQEIIQSNNSILKNIFKKRKQ